MSLLTVKRRVPLRWLVWAPIALSLLVVSYLTSLYLFAATVAACYCVTMLLAGGTPHRSGRGYRSRTWWT